MKFITATIAAFAIASAASAGNPVFEAPVEVEVMEEEMVEPVGSSAGGWIVPVLAVLAIAAAVAASDDDD